MKQENEDIKDKMKERLIKILDTKLETTMIYPLSQFESLFGDLWGNFKDESQLTEQEKIYRAKWKQCRNSILNNGNRQRRNMRTELDMHEVKWLRYQTVFIPMKKN